MKPKIILLTVMTAVLAGCGSFPHTPSSKVLAKTATDFDSEWVENNDKGAVILSANNNLAANYTIFNNMTISRTDNSEVKYELSLKNDTPQIVMLSPGEYKLTNVNFYGSMSAGKMTYSKSFDLKEHFVAKFTVSPSKIDYIGSINTIIIPNGERIDGSLFSSTSKQMAGASMKVSDNWNRDSSEIVNKYGRDIEDKINIKPMTVTRGAK
jgi:hypothetical protein